MRIIHVTDELMPSAGGLVSVPINLAAAQAGLGHDVFLIGRTGIEELLNSGEIQHIPHFDKVKLSESYAPGLLAKICPFKTVSPLRKLITTDSVIHLHGVWDPILLAASILARKSKARYIITPHSMLHPWQMTRFPLIKKMVFAIGWRAMFNHAQFIHCLNTAEQEHVAEFRFKTSSRTIPNGIFPENFEHQSPNAFLEKHPTLTEKPYILFLGRLHRQKGVTELLKGFFEFAQQSPDTQLVLAGPDYGERATLESLIQQSDFQDRVQLIGPIYGSEKKGALQAAQGFALISLNEGFSVALLEALTYSCPLLITKECNFPEAVSQKLGIIAMHETSSIANGLKQLTKMQKNNRAKEWISENYHWNTIALQTITHYEKKL